MIPPRGFKAEQYPLRHRLIYSCVLGLHSDAANTVFMPIVMSSEDMDVDADTIQVNPHNAAYEEDAGPLVRQMSIIDKLTFSLKLSMTEQTNDLAHTSGVSGAEAFTGDGVKSIRAMWRPIFGSFDEKLNAADDDTAVTVAAMLGLTVDATQKDVIPITTNKLAAIGSADLVQPMSTVNGVQVFGDFNLTTNTAMEDHVWDEDLFQAMLRRSTVKGALRSFVGSTRHFTLSRARPFKNYFVQKFVPRAIRRVVPFSFLGIQVHMPIKTLQAYHASTLSGTAHMGVQLIANYHEWNPEHDQDMGSQV